MDTQKKVIFSGIQPSGTPTLGNYVGAIRNWVHMQDNFDCLFSIVDLHAITVRQNPAELRKKSRDLLTMLIACGLDPEKNILYFQSHVPAHSELAWILNCYTYTGELSRMTQFKEKSSKYSDNINAGLMTYPILMAADILLYQADLVPVGVDQKQHLELSRDIAIRFNNIYGDVFKVPEPYIGEAGAKIMGLQNPEKKMSKSETDNANDVISLSDESDVIMRKFKRAVTDSDTNVVYAADKPGVSNLLDIYRIFTGKTAQEAEGDFKHCMGYAEFKTAVGETVASELKPIQDEFKRLSDEKTYINSIIKTNAERAAHLAARTLRKVYKKVGLVDLSSL